jgi:hypothetical protein
MLPKMELLHGCMPIVVYTVPATSASVTWESQDLVRVVLSLTVFLGNLQGISRALKVRSSYDELGAADLFGSLDHRSKIVRMSSRAMIEPSENRISEIYSNLRERGDE